MKKQIYNSNDGLYHGVEVEVNEERVVGFLMTAKVSGGAELPEHPNKPKEWWEGYEQALKDLIGHYDLSDEIIEAEGDRFESWLCDDEEERRGW